MKMVVAFPKFHRDAPPIPLDPIDRKARVRWCMDHRLWHYPAAHREPPQGREEERFRPSSDPRLEEMVHDGPDWITTEVLLGGFYDCVEFEVAYVDPATETIEDDEARNTAFRVWIEAGGWVDLSKGCVPPPRAEDRIWAHCHALSLDCGGPDMETAILELASRVEFHYGEGHEALTSAPSRCDLRKVAGVPDDAPAREQYVSTCVADADGYYCATCGYAVP